MSNKNAVKNARRAAQRATPPGESGIKPLRVVLPEYVMERLRADRAEGKSINDTIRSLQGELFGQPSTTGIGVERFMRPVVKPSSVRPRKEMESSVTPRGGKRPWSHHAERVLPEEYAISEEDFNLALLEARAAGRTDFTAHSLLAHLARR